ncbi:MAG: alpha/beta fold hydrolase, partial [Rhodospirillales bacterium]
CRYDKDVVVRKLMDYCETQDLGNKCYLHIVGDEKLNPAIAYDPLPAFAVVPGTGSAVRAPEKAKGLIIFMPGFQGWNTLPRIWPRLEASSMAPVLNALGERGWAVRRMNVRSFDRAYLSRNNEIWKALVESQIEAARKEGFRKVVLVGHSRGGAELLRALAAGARPDAAVVSEPDWLGPKYDREAKVQTTDEKRLDELGALLDERGDTPLLFFRFRASRWYGEMPDNAIGEILADGASMALAIENPEGFRGHGTFYSPAFSTAYASCLDRFLSGDLQRGDTCEPAQLDGTRRQDWAIESDLKAAGLSPVGNEALHRLMLGKTYCIYDESGGGLDEDLSCAQLTDHHWIRDSQVNARRAMLNRAEYDLVPDGFCRYDFLALEFPFCYRTYPDGDSIWLVDGKTSAILFRIAPVATGGLKHTDFTCTTSRNSRTPECERNAGS